MATIKELSIEEKAKRYDESLEKARKLKDEYNDIEGYYPNQWLCEELFPELKEESENERIRKDIVFYIAANHKDDGEKARWLYWLEKQGEKGTIGNEKEIPFSEQKSDDRVEPKFKVDDWVATDMNNVVQIKAIENGKYVLENRMSFSIDYVDKCWHLWTIQDAKDGDVLEFGDHGRLVVGIVSYVNKTTGKVDVNCLLENNNFKMGIYYNLDTIKPHPATKEQRELLFQKMKEAGYEWDAGKKELKKIEQKPVWSEEDERIRIETIELLETANHPNKMRSNGKPLDFTENIKWLKSIRPQNRCTYNPYKAVVESITEMCKHYDKATDLQDFYDNIKVKCKDAKEYDSLYPQNTWKPSDEQIKAIRLARSFVTDDFDEHPTLSETLIELEAQLKKLKEA